MDAFLPESFCPRQHFSAPEWTRLSWVNRHSGNTEGFGKHLKNLGAPRVGQYMIALGLKSKSQLPGRGQVPSVGSSEDRTVFWSAEGLSWGISQHLPQVARSGNKTYIWKQRAAWRMAETEPSWASRDKACYRAEIKMRGAAGRTKLNLQAQQQEVSCSESGNQACGWETWEGLNTLSWLVSAGCRQSLNASLQDSPLI